VDEDKRRLRPEGRRQKPYEMEVLGADDGKHADKDDAGKGVVISHLAKQVKRQ